MPEQPSASGSAQPLVLLNPATNEISTYSCVPASEGASPSPPIPMQHVGQASQELLQMEARWRQHYEDRAEKYEAKCFRRSQECESRWYERWESKNQEIQELSAEVASLIVEFSPQVFLLYLTGMQATVLYEKTARLELEHKFNLSGALGNNPISHQFSCH